MRKGRIAIIALTAALALGIFSACGSSNTSDDASDDTAEETDTTEVQDSDDNEDATESEDAAESEEDASAASDEETESTEPKWTIVDSSNVMHVDIVDGDSKSVTFRFENDNDGDNVFYGFDKVTMGGESYSIEDGVDGFEGIPLAVAENGKDLDNFTMGPTLADGESLDYTFTMKDGSDLPDSIKITYDASMTYKSPSQKVQKDDFPNQTLTLQYGDES